MSRHTITYRFENTHSRFHSLLAWGHNYFTFLGREVKVLTTHDKGAYKFVTDEEKTWVKVKFIARVILSFTLVIPAFAFLLKMGFHRWVQVDYSNTLAKLESLPRPSSGSLVHPLVPPTTTGSTTVPLSTPTAPTPPVTPPVTPPPSRVVPSTPPAQLKPDAVATPGDVPPSPLPIAAESPPVSEPLPKEDLQKVARQNELRTHIWEESSLKATSQLTSRDRTAWYKSLSNIPAKVAFILAYRAAKAQWDTEKGDELMPQPDRISWGALTAIYNNLQPNEQVFNETYGPTTPFGCIAEKFDDATMTLNWTAQEAAIYLNEDANRVDAFRKHCTKMRIPQAISKGADTPNTENAKKPKVDLIARFIMAVYSALLQPLPKPNDSSKAASQYAAADLWKGALVIIPEGRTDLTTKDLVGSVDHFKFLKDYAAALVVWKRLPPAEKELHKERWDRAKEVFKTVQTAKKTELNQRLEAFNTALRDFNSKAQNKDRTPAGYAQSIRGTEQANGLKELAALIKLFNEESGTPKRDAAGRKETIQKLQAAVAVLNRELV